MSPSAISARSSPLAVGITSCSRPMMAARLQLSGSQCSHLMSVTGISLCEGSGLHGRSWMHYLGRSRIALPRGSVSSMRISLLTKTVGGMHNFLLRSNLTVLACVLTAASGADTCTISRSTGSVSIIISSPDDRGMIRKAVYPQLTI